MYFNYTEWNYEEMVRRGSLTPDVDERVSVFGSFALWPLLLLLLL